MEEAVVAVTVADTNDVDNLPGTSGAMTEQLSIEGLPPMSPHMGELNLPCEGPHYVGAVMTMRDDVAPKPIQVDRVSLPISTVNLANMMVSQGLVDDFITSLQKQDTFALKVLVGMISDVFGQPVDDVATASITQTSTLETVADNQTSEVYPGTGAGSRQSAAQVQGSTRSKSEMSVAVATTSRGLDCKQDAPKDSENRKIPLSQQQEQHVVTSEDTSDTSLISSGIIIHTGDSEEEHEEVAKPTPAKSGSNPVKTARDPGSAAPNPVSAAPNPVSAAPNPVRAAANPVRAAPNPVNVARKSTGCIQKSAKVRTLTKPTRPHSPQLPQKVGGGALVMTSAHSSSASGVFKNPGLTRNRGSVISNQSRETMVAPSSSFGARSAKAVSMPHCSDKVTKKSKHRPDEEEHKCKVRTAAKEKRRKSSDKEMLKRSIEKQLWESSDSDSEEARTPAKKSRRSSDDFRSHSSTKVKKALKEGRGRHAARSSDSDDSDDRRHKTSEKKKMTKFAKKKVDSSSETGDEGYICGVCKIFLTDTRWEMAKHQKRCGRAGYKYKS